MGRLCRKLHDSIQPLAARRSSLGGYVRGEGQCPFVSHPVRPLQEGTTSFLETVALQPPNPSGVSGGRGIGHPLWETFGVVFGERISRFSLGGGRAILNMKPGKSAMLFSSGRLVPGTGCIWDTIWTTPWSGH